MVLEKYFNDLKLEEYLLNKFWLIIQRRVMHNLYILYVQNVLMPFHILINKQIVNRFLSPKFISCQNFLCEKKTIPVPIESMVALMTKFICVFNLAAILNCLIILSIIISVFFFMIDFFSKAGC